MLRHLVGIEPGHVLDDRGLDGGGVVARRQHAAGQGFDLASLLFDRPGREVAPPAGDDLVALAVGADEERHQNAARPDQRQDVRDIGLGLAVPHVEGRRIELADGDMEQFHDGSSFS